MEVRQFREAAAHPADPMPVWKRAIDIAGATILLVALAPSLLLIATVIKMSSPGSSVLKQRRIGRQGKSFTLFKFRTMRPNADEGVHQDHLTNIIAMDVPMTKLDVAHDPRVFPAGKIIRRCYLDELPQLINVLRGDMSLVGPRPCLPYEARQLKTWQMARFRVLPGMTGLWQVSGKNKTTFTEMIRLDIAYADRLSLLLDAKILFKTIPVILLEVMERFLRRSVSPARHLSTTAFRKNS